MSTPHSPHDHDSLFDRLEPPQPPAELRDRALGAGTEALQREPAPDVWERLWRSRALRLAWGASVLLLLGGHGAVLLAVRCRGVETPQRMAGFVDAELEEVVSLPRIDPAVVADVAWWTGSKNDQTQSGGAS